MICSCKKISRADEELINFPTFIHDSYNTVSKKVLIEHCKNANLLSINLQKNFKNILKQQNI